MKNTGEVEKPLRTAEVQEAVSYELAAKTETLLTSPYDAFGEMVDNALDAAIAGRLATLNIQVDNQDGEVVVSNFNTTGMSDKEIPGFLNWGESTKNDLTKIGRMGVGVKAASRFLTQLN